MHNSVEGPVETLRLVPSASVSALRPGQSYGFSLDSDEREEESTGKPRTADDSRERRERPEEPQRPGWERRTSADDRRKRREDSEPRLFMACDDTQDPPEGTEKPGMCDCPSNATFLFLIFVVQIRTFNLPADDLFALCFVQIRAKLL